MMDLLLATSGGESQSASSGYVDDVFSAYTYTGNGSTQTINNGIDLAGKGGLVWIKSRSGGFNHGLIDTVRGRGSVLHSDTTGGADATSAGNGISSFNSNGFSLGQDQYTIMNENNSTFASWTFRRAPKFFDCGTFTQAAGMPAKTIPHSLGADIGFLIIKRTGSADSWKCYHRSLGTGQMIFLNLNNAADATSQFGTIDASSFTLASGWWNAGDYIWYAFAHDPSAEGIIQCGSFTHTSVGANATVNLGWEPQYLLIKGVASSGWTIFDTMRGIISGGVDALIQPSNSNAESNATNYVDLIPTGFVSQGRAKDPGDYIYLAIRRPNKPPTTGTQVYNAIARTGTDATATVTGVGFAPDFLIAKSRATARSHLVQDRLRGVTAGIYPDLQNQESMVSTAVTSFGMDGVSIGTSPIINSTAFGEPYINHFFRRATGFMDVVCDTGTGVAHGVNHGLSVAPEFVIRKSRSGSTQWECWHSALTATEKLVLNTTATKVTDATAWNSTLPTSTQFTVGTGANVNTNAATYVTYLFATLAGISKVGSYTGNGTSQTINCGFSTGSRFILVKRTDATGDWYVWDSVRGIIAANDPHLSLNTAAAEVTTDDSVDPDASGFIVNQNTATNINVNGGQYIFLAIA